GRAPVDKLRYSELVVAGGAVVVRPRPLSVPPGAESRQPDSWVCFPPHRVATASAVASSASTASDPVAVRSLPAGHASRRQCRCAGSDTWPPPNPPCSSGPRSGTARGSALNPGPACDPGHGAHLRPAPLPARIAASRAAGTPALARDLPAPRAWVA